ncbi:MAG: Glu-tRNA(Gln) amidotransferase subunit GatE, partial [Nanoarchaeota archaeon]|nr:Glu-tRNA(Gln) amidotransferase subunit GatE [Nanoarchaeota archaeon]
MVIDYKKIGFKSGLEIHQQLNTGKLFSRTPSLLRSDAPDFEISRKLHAIAGETGKVDDAVKHEASLEKEFIYQGYLDSISLVELDEAPPELIDNEALEIGLQIALLLNCEIIPVTQVMRKTVIDGSNTGGFQRTVLIARNGFIETSEGKVGIESVALEEDACRIISREEKKVVYRLDRLGIPLIEITTAPDLKNAEHVKETALKIGELLRVCNVRRGIGTIRQDVNISVTGHPRVEIKGFQDPKIMVKTIEKEVERQLEKQGESEVRNALPDGSTKFLRPMPGSARMYPETDLPLLEISKNLIDKCKQMLPKLISEVRKELKQQGLSDEMIKLVLSKNKVEEFKQLIGRVNEADLVAKVLILWPRDFAKKLALDIPVVESRLHLDVLESVLEALEKKLIEKHDLRDVLMKIVKGAEVKDALKIEKVSLDGVEEFV